MSPFDEIALVYERRGWAFAPALAANLNDGFVFSTPEFFIMGRERGDAWFIEAFAGDTAKAWSILPWEKPFVEFQRFDNVLRRVPIGTLRRMTLSSHEMADSTHSG